VLSGAFRESCERGGFRLVHYVILSNHIHLVCEAKDRVSLSRGVQGLCVRIAKRLNRLWNRLGKVFADRFHDRILRTPREVRNALAYVLQNARRHGVVVGQREPDPLSSGRWFDGWRDLVADWTSEAPIARARTWLLSKGWRRHRLIGLADASHSRMTKARRQCGREALAWLTSTHGPRRVDRMHVLS
jgi:REP element-mobilizing transposase RayT